MSSTLGHLLVDPTIAERSSPPFPVAASAEGSSAPSTINNPTAAIESQLDGPAEGSDSEAETIVLPPRRQRNGGTSRLRNGNGLAEAADDSDSDQSVGRQAKKTRKRRDIDAYSSELSSAPSSPRGTTNIEVSPSSPSALLRPQQSSASRHSRKRKAPMERENGAAGISRDSPMTIQPQKISRSSPPFSPSPPRQPSPANNTRTRAIQTAHAPIKNPAHRVSKPRKAPPPLRTSRDREGQSPALSRQGSPAGFPLLPKPLTTRTPGSPVNMNLPHKPKRDSTGRTLLHRAAYRGNLEEVMNIYNQDRDLLNAEDNAGYLPLHEASLEGHTEVVRFLLACGSWYDIQSHNEGDTPLMDAAENGHVDVVRLLLETGADPRKRNKSGFTAIECLDKTLDNESPEYNSIYEALDIAAKKVRSKRSSEDECRGSAPVDSVSSRDPSVTSPVPDPPTATGRQTTSRRRNARADQTKNEMLWVEGGKNGLQKLREKARMGDTEIVAACLERGIVPDVESLISAIKGGHDDTVSLLLAFNANADPKPSPSSKSGNNRRANDETPMLAAIGRSNLKILEMLISQVDPTRLDSRGKSYADIARERGGDYWEQEVKMLQEAIDNARRSSSKANSNSRSSPRLEKSTTTTKKTLEQPRRKRSRSRRDSSPPVKRSISTHSKREGSGSDGESVDTSLRKTERRKGPDFSPQGLIKKKRRLISGKDLIAEKPANQQSKAQTRSSLAEQTRPSKFEEMSDDTTSKSVLRPGRSRDRLLEKKSDKSNSEKQDKEKQGMIPMRDREKIKGSMSSLILSSQDIENKRRKRDRSSIRELDGVSKVKKTDPETKHKGRGELHSRADSEMHSGDSGREDIKEMTKKDEDLKRARRLAKEESRKKRAFEGDQHSEETAHQRKVKAMEESERLEKEAKEVALQTQKVLEEKETRRQQHLATEQMATMERAREDSYKGRAEMWRIRQQALDEEKRRKEAEEAEEKRIAERKRVEEEERRIADEKLRAAEERRRLLEEEARAKALAEEMVQKELREAAERRRLEEEAEFLRKQELEERKRVEEEAAKRRLEQEEAQQRELSRRESLPYTLKLAAETCKNEFCLEVATLWLPFYSDGREHRTAALEGQGVEGKSIQQPSDWILNIQVALVLGTTDLYLREFNFESRDLTLQHRERMWSCMRSHLSKPILRTSRSFDVLRDQQDNKEKFLTMEPLFWIKLKDFYRMIKSDSRYTGLLSERNKIINTCWVDLDYDPTNPQQNVSVEHAAANVEKINRYRESLDSPS